MTAIASTVCFDRFGADAPASDRSRQRQQAGASQPILCARCESPITHKHDAIEVDGAHQHEFTNPAGLVFTIGCFGAADGCNECGAFSVEHTWFAGSEWRFVQCRSCAAHLGWVYRYPAHGERFFGLILRLLIDR